MCYNSTMGYKKGLQWNQGQLQIAFYLQKDLTPKEISQQYGFPLRTCFKVKAAMESGNDPGEVTEEMIKAAPVPVVFGAAAASKSKSVKQAPAKLPGPVAKPAAKKGIPAVHTSAIQLVAQTQPIPMTPDIYISYMVACGRGYQGDLVDWLSLVSRDFWLGRGQNMYDEMAAVMAGHKEEEVAAPIG